MISMAGKEKSTALLSILLAVYRSHGQTSGLLGKIFINKVKKGHSVLEALHIKKEECIAGRSLYYL